MTAAARMPRGRLAMKMPAADCNEARMPLPEAAKAAMKMPAAMKTPLAHAEVAMAAIGTAAGTCRDSDGGDRDGTARKISNDGEHQQEEHDHPPLARQASAWAQTGRVLMVASRTWSASSEEGDEDAARASSDGGVGGAASAKGNCGNKDAACASSNSGKEGAERPKSDCDDEYAAPE